MSSSETGRTGGGTMRAVAVAVAALVVASPASAGAEDVPEYELDELLDKARDYAPLLAEHEARRDHAEARQTRADRAWWPSLQTDSRIAPVPSNADPTRIDRNVEEISSFQLGPYFRQTARVTMPIYTFGRISTARQLAELGVDVAELEREEAMQDHLQRTRQAFYGRQLARTFGELLEEGADIVRDELEQMEEDRAFGQADFETEDLRRLQIFDAELDTMILDNERLRDLTEAALLYLTDMEGPLEVPRLDPERAHEPLEDLESYQEAARIHRPELRQLERGIEARRLEEQMQRREFFPNFYAAASFEYGWSTEEPALQPVCRRDGPDEPCEDLEDTFARPYTNPFDTLTFGVAVGMRWNFDLPHRRGRLREARAQRAEIEAQHQRAIGGLMLQIEEVWREADDARRRIEIQERRYDAARRWRNQYGLQEQMGRDDRDMEEMLDPLREYYQARVAYLEAAHNYLVARAELARKVGVERLEDVDPDSLTPGGFEPSSPAVGE